MRKETLLDLAEKWNRLAEPPEVQDRSSTGAMLRNAEQRGLRDGYSKAAYQLITLINLLEE